MIKLLLDQGLPRTAAALMREAGYDAIHVGDAGMAEASDEDILQAARNESRIVVTLDADFHALLALSGAASPSVIRIRIEGLRGEALAQLLLSAIRKCGGDLEAGAVVTIQERRLRIRRLPLVRE
jgi:predicted nuclease of predicted toxin-antitoxin system